MPKAKLKILHSDDENEWNEVLLGIIKDAGLENQVVVEWEPNAEGTIAKARHKKWDLIISDLFKPLQYLQGPGVIKTMRGFDSSTPIWIWSSASSKAGEAWADNLSLQYFPRTWRKEEFASLNNLLRQALVSLVDNV